MAGNKYQKVEVPVHMRNLKRDAYGNPRPFFISLSQSGHPFSEINAEKWEDAFRKKQCWICGQHLEDEVAFVGAPMNVTHRYFSSLPMHQDCAEYAMQVCPFMVVKNFEGINPENDNKLEPIPRPAMFLLGVTKSYEKFPSENGLSWIKAGEWMELYWWNFGERVVVEANPLADS